MSRAIVIKKVWKVSLQSIRIKDYIIKQKVRYKDLRLDLRSSLSSGLRFKVKSEIKIKEVLKLRLEARIREQAIDKEKKKSYSMLNSF